MSEHYCPECADGWSGAYTCELRCTTCGSALKVRDADPSRLNPEVEIKELNAVIDQLTERAEKAERERDALAAHVETGKALVRTLLEIENPLEDPYVVNALAVRAETWLGRTLETSPTPLKAQWQVEALEDYGNQHFGAGSNELRGIQSDAKRLRRQAEAQPHSVEDDV